MIPVSNNNDETQQNQNGELLERIASFAKDILSDEKYMMTFYEFPYEDRLVIRLQSKVQNDEQVLHNEQRAPEVN